MLLVSIGVSKGCDQNYEDVKKSSKVKIIDPSSKIEFLQVYSIPKEIIRGVLWPTETKKYFKVWWINKNWWRKEVENEKYFNISSSDFGHDFKQIFNHTWKF